MKQVRRPKPWGWIAVYGVLAVVVFAGLGYAVYLSNRTDTPQGGVTAIPDVVDYRTTDPGSLTRNHKPGVLSYKVHPPVGGDHNATWQNCSGAIYTAQIPDEHAVHSLEHGAVWITYRSGLPADQIAELAARVRGHDYTMLSPYPGLDKPISVQAWGYQLKVDSADDQRLDQFINATRIAAAPEPGAACSGGNTTTGSIPNDSGTGMPQARLNR